MTLNGLDKQLLNNYQQDFPLLARPYLAIAEQLGTTENTVLDAFQSLSEQGFISRIGSIIQPNKIGVSSLMAMSVPVEKIKATAEIINSFVEVNHNYEREHTFNLWFVLIADNAEHLQQVISDIEQQTGFESLSLPLLQDYFINLGFQLDLSHL